MKRIVAVLLLLLPTSVLGADKRSERWVDKTLRSMTLDEKIGQKLVPCIPNAGFRGDDTLDVQNVRNDIEQFHVGGFHTFGGDPSSVALLLNEAQRMSKVPLLVTADFEGGAGYTMFGATRLPRAMTIGATGDTNLAYQAGAITAQEGRAIGVNVNFYPVADVQNNPENPIINIRSFGSDPARVSEFVRAYIRGAQDNGELATAKHFPGHGDVTTDSHLEMPVLPFDRARLESIELPPFKAAVAQDVGAVMIAHIWLPKIEPENGVPSTLSKNVVTGLLRDELHFGGVVFTDAMTMLGVSAKFTPADAAVRTVEAGVDEILCPVDLAASFNAIKDAVQSGKIPESTIDESARRILRAKASLGLMKMENRIVDVNRLMSVLGTQAHRDLAQQIADRAITLVRDDRHVLPLKASPDERIVQINILDTRSGWREGTVGVVAAAELAKRFPRAVTVTIDDESTPNEYDMVRKMAQLADAVVVNGFVRVASYKGSIGLATREVVLLKDLAAMKKPFVFTVFGSPYVLTHVPDIPSYILTYDITPMSEMAMVRAITGEIPFQGKLPVELPGLYPVGYGLTLK